MNGEMEPSTAGKNSHHQETKGDLETDDPREENLSTWGIFNLEGEEARTIRKNIKKVLRKEAYFSLTAAIASSGIWHRTSLSTTRWHAADKCPGPQTAYPRWVGGQTPQEQESSSGYNAITENYFLEDFYSQTPSGEMLLPKKKKHNSIPHCEVLFSICSY